VNRELAPSMRGISHSWVEEARQMYEAQMTAQDYEAQTAPRGVAQASAGAFQAYEFTEDAFLGHEDEGALSWQERALCAQTDPEAFFPEKGGSTREAKKVCMSCDVRGECLEYALANDERFGIWGGLSERERRKLKKRAV
jgi:WhiB family redox-sensing transcriptional regulator